MRRLRPDPFAACALLAHTALVWRLQVTAWPEVTTPAYLVSRGWVLYRDIGFVHTPGLMHALGALFGTFGAKAWVVKVFALFWPLAAHALQLRETRASTLAVRFWSSAFFLALFYSWGGNAIWPPVMISALSIPIASALDRGRARTAGLWIGLAILIKQTAGYVLLLAVAALLARRSRRDAALLFGIASAPYLVVWGLFAAAGSGEEFLRWTLAAPFQYLYGTIRVAPNAFGIFTIALAFAPLILETALETLEGRGPRTAWYLLTAVGLGLMAYPRFGPLQMAAAVPCLAVGVARLLGRPDRRLARAALAATAGIVLSTAPILAASYRFDGSVVFWNDEPSLRALADHLRRLPPERRVHSEVWENVLPQSGRLPPGRFYAHPWLMAFIAQIDSAERRMREASEQPGTVVVSRGPVPRSGRIGPYALSER